MHRSPMGAASIQQFVTMGAAQAWQQLSVLQGELFKSFEVQHQPALVTTVHVSKRKAATEEEGDENDEEQRKSASRENWPPVPGVAMKGSCWFYF